MIRSKLTVEEVAAKRGLERIKNLSQGETLTEDFFAQNRPFISGGMVTHGAQRGGIAYLLRPVIKIGGTCYHVVYIRRAGKRHIFEKYECRERVGGAIRRFLFFLFRSGYEG